MDSNQKVCPKCGEHHKLTCVERFESFFDSKEFELIKTPVPKDDPLNFVDKKKYTDRLKAARKQVINLEQLNNNGVTLESTALLQKVKELGVEQIRT